MTITIILVGKLAAIFTSEDLLLDRTCYCNSQWRFIDTHYTFAYVHCMQKALKFDKIVLIDYSLSCFEILKITHPSEGMPLSVRSASHALICTNTIDHLAIFSLSTYNKTFIVLLFLTL